MSQSTGGDNKRLSIEEHLYVELAPDELVAFEAAKRAAQNYAMQEARYWAEQMYKELWTYLKLYENIVPAVKDRLMSKISVP